MQRQGIFAVVTFLLFGHIYSAAITRSETITTSSPKQDASAATPAASQPQHHHGDELQVDGSNPILGDMPIFQEEIVKILNTNNVPLRNCKEILDAGTFNKSGLYVIQPGSIGGEFVAYCDMTLLGGGWTIIHRRHNSKLSFNRDYSSYRNGFGDFTENFWLGLDKINRLTDLDNSDSAMEVYFGLQTFYKYSSYSRYGQFSVGTEMHGYPLQISDHDGSSSAGDPMSFYNGQRFSTRDRDQDNQKSTFCHQTFQGYKGGWWFKDCVYTNLNGMYYEDGPNRDAPDGLIWRTFSDNYSLKTTVIAVRPS